MQKIKELQNIKINLPFKTIDLMFKISIVDVSGVDVVPPANFAAALEPGAVGKLDLAFEEVVNPLDLGQKEMILNLWTEQVIADYKAMIEAQE